MQDKRGLILKLMIAAVIIVAGFLIYLLFFNKLPADTVCVPAECCHATSCVTEDNAPNCPGTLCSQECAPGSVDCNQATCEFIKGKCVLVPNEEVEIEAGS